MTDILKTINQHRSIRKFENKAVDDKLLNTVLEAGIKASNTGNMQVYSIIITKDKENKEAIAPFHFNQPMVKEAPVILTFCADINRFNKWCEARNAIPGYDNLLWFINASIDATLVAQNVCIAAEAHGLGICYLGTTSYNADKFIEFYNLPKGVIPVTTVVLGYPASIPEITSRLPLSAVIHNEKYQDYTVEDINKLYEETESLELTKKLIEENKTENLAQIFTNKRYKKEDNEFFSEKLIQVLKNQGFIK